MSKINVVKMLGACLVVAGLSAAATVKAQAGPSAPGPRCQGYSVQKVVHCCEQMVTNPKYRHWMTSTGNCSSSSVSCKKAPARKETLTHVSQPKMVCWLNIDKDRLIKRPYKRNDDTKTRETPPGGNDDTSSQDSGGNDTGGNQGGGKP